MFFLFYNYVIYWLLTFFFHFFKGACLGEGVQLQILKGLLKCYFVYVCDLICMNTSYKLSF